MKNSKANRNLDSLPSSYADRMGCVVSFGGRVGTIEDESVAEFGATYLVEFEDGGEEWVAGEDLKVEKK